MNKNDRFFENWKKFYEYTEKMHDETIMYGCANCPMNSDGSERCAIDYIRSADAIIKQNHMRKQIRDGIIHKGVDRLK